MARPSSRAAITLAYPLTYPADPGREESDHGYLHHWLTLGPADQRIHDQPVHDVQIEAAPIDAMPIDAMPIDAMPEAGESRTGRFARLLAAMSSRACDFDQVVELERVMLDEVAHTWEVTHLADDHWLGWYGLLPALTYRRAWGYAQLHSAAAQSATLQVDFISRPSGVVRLWLNGGALMLERSAAEGAPYERETYTANVTLQAGANRLLLRAEQVGAGESALLASVRILPGTGAAALSLHLPTVSPNPRRRRQLDEIYAQTHLDRAVYTSREPIRLLAPARTRKVPVQLRLQKPGGAIYAETLGTLTSGGVIESVRGIQLPHGALDAVVMAPFQEFYNGKLRARHVTPLLIANRPFYPQPPAAGDPTDSADTRLIEALTAQVQSGDSVYGELAKMAFGTWEQVAPPVIDQAVTRVLDGAADALPDLLALITMRARMPAYRGFPTALLPVLDRGLTHFAARPAERWAAWDSADDAAQLALLAARHLTAQLYPAAAGSSSDADTVVAWLAQRGQQGLAQWHSDHALLVMALAPLISLSHHDSVRESAAALLDTLALAWATHSLHGTFGATRAHVDSATVRSGRFAPEAALMRLLWGMGGYERGLPAATALGLVGASYTLPEVVRAIALGQPDAAWVQERHVEANVATYKTPDYILSSVQDYRPGAAGAHEHLWQATLGPEALVFTTHPLSLSQAAQAMPGWWVGNGVLPRLAQYHDALIARYTLPAGDWLAFTHAHFPLNAFDEHEFVENWAFGRVGEGYVALWAAPAFTLMHNGPDAGRELRVHAARAVWLCQMGRRATDGDFAAFQRKVLAHAPQCSDDIVTWTTARGDTLALGDVGPLLVNGQAVPLEHYPRHSSPFGHADFPAEHLDIVYGEDGLRLRFVPV